jgi:hypothetical protein
MQSATSSFPYLMSHPQLVTGTRNQSHYPKNKGKNQAGSGREGMAKGPENSAGSLKSVAPRTRRSSGVQTEAIPALSHEYREMRVMPC